MDTDYETLIEQAPKDLQSYIGALERENARLRQELADLRSSTTRRARPADAGSDRTAAAALARPQVHHPSDVMVAVITRHGQAKRTPLNEYAAQRRGGTGVYDIQAARDDPVAHLQVARASAGLLVVTTRGRAFRVSVDTLPLTETRGRGISLPERLQLTQDEAIGAVLAIDDEDPRQNVLLATANGWVRPWHRNYLGDRLQPGTLLYDPQRGGSPVAMALSSGEADVLIALRSGLAYRFPESQLRRDGVRGIQVHPDDTVVGLAAVDEDGTVIMVTADGQGARREMSTFGANKSPGGQGKQIMKSTALVGLAAARETDEVLGITGMAKIIRFAVADVPIKSGAVQGVSVLDARGDTVAAMALAPAPGAGS
jgi:DNA gyrase subunit A